MGLGFATLGVLAGLIVVLAGNVTAGSWVIGVGVLVGVVALALNYRRHRDGPLHGTDRLRTGTGERR